MTELLKRLEAQLKAAAYVRRDYLERLSSGERVSTEDTRSYELAQREVDRLSEIIESETRAEERETEASASYRAATSRAGGKNRPYVSDPALMDSFRSAIFEKNPAPILARWNAARSYFQPGIEKRDLLTTAPANMMPVSFYDRLVEHMVESSAVLRAGATLITTESGEPLRVPRSTALSTAAIIAEAGPILESDPTLSVVTLGAFKYGFRLQVSYEMAEDAGFDLEGYLAREAGQAIGRAIGSDFILGAGGAAPRGVLLDAGPGATGPAGTGTSFGVQATAGMGTDLLYDLEGSLAEPYTLEPSTGWLMRNATLTALRKLKATAGESVGNDFVREPTVKGASASIIGHPAFVDPFMPSMAGAAESIAFGAWRSYFVRMVNGIRFERSNDFSFANDLIDFRCLIRADGALVDTTAIKTFVHTV